MNSKIKEKQPEITKRDKQVIEYIAAGYNITEITQFLKVKYPTLRGIISHLLAKTQTITNAQLINWAYKNGILKVED